MADRDAIRKARLHPFKILLGLRAYGGGVGLRNAARTWDVSSRVLDALDGAFYESFANVVPSGKRHLLALDVSGSMGSPLGNSCLSCREAAGAMAMVTMASEPKTHVVGFAGGRHGLVKLDISPRQRLRDVVKTLDRKDFGSTDCALPMLYALDNGIEVDVFVVYTDNETWFGSVHPVEALRRYRRKTGIDARLIVVGMTTTKFSIADPADGGMLDVVGFDADVPAVMAEFAK